MREYMGKIIKGEQNDVLPTWAALLTILVISTFIIESPIKYMLGKVGLGSAIYARDVFALAIPFWMFIRWVTGSKPNASIIVFFILFAHALYGVLIIQSFIQPTVALKVYLYTLLGASLYPTLVAYQEPAKKWALIMLTLTLLGIGINFFTEMPWAGEVFETATGTRQISRDWTTGGIRRLSGFARASYDAATFAALLGTTVCVYTLRSRIAQSLLLILISAAVVLTTSKGAVLALVLLIPYVLISNPANENKFPRLLHTAPLGMLLIPATFYLTGYEATVGSELWFLLSSFAERINWMWPGAFELLSSPWLLAFGRGLGGIGLPQKFGEGMLYNSADNAMVYLFISMGAISIFYIQFVFLRLEKSRTQIPNKLWICMMCWLIYWIVYGFTTNLFENPVISTFFGIIIGAALQQKKREQ